MKTRITTISLLLSLWSILIFGQVTVTLQPGAADGKDADIRNDYPITPNGTSSDFIANAWTAGGSFIQRSLIDFDFSSIPVNATILSAALSLYANPTTGHSQHHSSASGSNECYLKRIITSWNENTVCWSNQPSTTELNKVLVAQSTSGLQDYPNINVKDLVQDIVNNPTTSFGMLFMLKTESKYRSMIFSSSDHPTANLHPKLVITYEITCSTINGNIKYANADLTALSGLKVMLFKSGTIPCDSTNTDTNGNFTFTVCGSGNYIIVPRSDFAVHGINATDSYIALRHYTGQVPLQGLSFLAGDVNHDQVINATDSYLIAQRYVRQITTFPPGDWVIETKTLTLPQSDPIQVNLKALCYGDLDASWYH